MSYKTPLPENISKALALDGEPESIRRYYAQWARTYDADVGRDHVAPLHMVNALLQWLSQHRPAMKPAEFEVMDVGCGTGMVGLELRKVGIQHIDGIDISVEMIEQCSQLNVYRQLIAEVDINQPIPEAWHGRYELLHLDAAPYTNDSTAHYWLYEVGSNQAS